jgi:hypothetical protein
MIIPRICLRWASRGLVPLVLWAGCAIPLLGEGKAARFQGVERWQATGTTEMTIQIQGQTKQRKNSHQFKLERHQVQGTTETWEGTSTVKRSDKDSNRLMWGSVSGEATADYRLELDANADEALLHVHVHSVKGKGQFGILGGAGQPFSVDQPDRDIDLRAPITDDSDSLVFRQDIHTDLMVGALDSISILTFVPDEVPLKAVLAVGSAVRGGKVHLDGSKSKGRIRTFTWTLTPEASSGGQTVTFETTGSSTDMVLLANVHVSLTVSDGRKTSPPANGDAKAIPRKWKTKTDPGTPSGPWLGAGNLTPGGQMLGQNQDRESGSTLPWLQPIASTNHWEGRGFKISAEPVNDPGRPFDGFYFVTDYSLHVLRKMVIQPDLLGSEYNGVNLSVVNHKDAKHGADFDLLLDQVHTHERLHTDIVREHLAAVDPVKEVEALIYQDPDGLILRVNGKIGVAEGVLQGDGDPAFHGEIARRMPARFQRGGEVFVHDGAGGTAAWSIPSYALLTD